MNETKHDLPPALTVAGVSLGPVEAAPPDPFDPGRRPARLSRRRLQQTLLPARDGGWRIGYAEP
jgi:hypothetical protein